jgi:uncharacterized membrane protein YraQ (UPF0718 family)
MSIALTVLLIVCAFVIGLIVGISIPKIENLTKEEYAHCVQMIIGDYNMHEKAKRDLIDEIQQYAMVKEAKAEHLSKDAAEIVGRVIEMLRKKTL